MPFTPTGGYVPYVPPLVGAVLLPGHSEYSSYYGRPLDYDYQDPWYSGADIGSWNRLPYACGVYGYC